MHLALDFSLDCGILLYKKDKKEPLTRKKKNHVLQNQKLHNLFSPQGL